MSEPTTDPWEMVALGPDPTDADRWEGEPKKFEAPAEAKASKEKPRQLTFRTAAEMIKEPRPAEIIEGVAWAGCVTVLVSESTTGKTFLLLDAAAAVGEGLDWHGRRTKRGSVAYVSFEGDAIGIRLRALQDAKKQDSTNVYFARASDPLSPRVGRDGVEAYSMGEALVTEALTNLSAELAAKGLPPIVLLVVDTIRASLAGSEDSSEHVSAYLRAVRRIMTAVPAAGAVLAHHSGWLDGETKRKRERGSSAWRGNSEGTLYLEADESSERGTTYLTMRTLKTRDAERPAPLHLVRRRVDILATDEHGEPESSCVIERDTRSRETVETNAAAEATAQARALDLKVLRVIEARPELATSHDRIRELAAAKKTDVGASVGRLLRDGLILPGKRGEPYTLTPEGLKTAQEGTSKP